MGDCPDGTSCEMGMCRSATGPCPKATDPCPSAPPPPAGCGQPFALLDPGGCGVVCPSTQLQHDDVQAACGPDWRAGILDSLSELNMVPVTQARFWVGAERTGSNTFSWFTGTPVDPSAWDTGFPSGGGDSCVYLNGARKRLRNDEGCDSDNPFICTYPPTN
jgi:hypothetical protein